jgi:hypothetical protein
MITPETTLPQPNVIYASRITLGMSIQDGQPQGNIYQIVLQGAVVDADGKWTDTQAQNSLNGISFTFDANGNAVGLPDDIAVIAPSITQIWADLVTAIGQINSARKLL